MNMATAAGSLLLWITLVTWCVSISMGMSVKGHFDHNDEFVVKSNRTRSDGNKVAHRAGRTKRSQLGFLQRPLDETQEIALNLSPRGIWGSCMRSDINTAGIYTFRIQEIPRNSVRGYPGPIQDALYCDERRGVFPAYWLPWWQRASGAVVTLPFIDVAYISGVQFLFTGLLSGCSVVVVAHPTDHSQIRVFHDSKPDYPANKWRDAGLTVLAEVSWCHYGDIDSGGIFAITFMQFDQSSMRWNLVTQCLGGSVQSISPTVPNNDLSYVYSVRRCPDANRGNIRVVEVPPPSRERTRERSRTMPGSNPRTRSRSSSRSGKGNESD